MQKIEHNRMRLILLLMCAVFLFSSWETAHAQVGGIDTSSTLRLTPPYPGPNAEVSVALNAYAMDSLGATIRWYADDIELRQFRNARGVTLTTGEIGTEQRIRAVVTPTSGAPVTIAKTLSPSSVDLIIEAETAVPSFYGGRALPTPESAVRIIAIPHTGGNESSYTYSWELDNKALFGGPILGKNVIEFNLPKFEGALLSVSIMNNNDVVAKRSVRLSAAEPEVHFYELNPLRGMETRAITDTFSLFEGETTFTAAPYFMSNDSAAHQVIEWTIDGRVIENPSEDPRSITLRKEGGTGGANVAFKINDTKKLLQYAAGSFNVFFES